MQYQRILTSFFNQPLAILPEKLAEIRAFLTAKANGETIAADRVAEVTAARRSDGVQMAGRVAVLPVFGTIAQRVGALERASGGVSTEEIGQALDGLVSDRQVRAIVMVYDSPGGSVAGVPELAAKIFKARDEKKIVALADSMAASAAFWLAAQASEFYLSPGAITGSVGVLTAHMDQSKLEENLGVKTTYITSSRYKAETNPSQPLSEEARANLQSMVDKYHGMFVSALAKGRGVSEAKVEKDFGQGRVMIGKDAVANGLADGIATLPQLLQRYAGGETARAQAVARARSVEIA